MPYRLPSCSAARMRSCVVGFLSTICSAPLPTPSFSFPIASPLITLVRYCNISSWSAILFFLFFSILLCFLFFILVFYINFLDFIFVFLLFFHIFIYIFFSFYLYILFTTIH